MATYAYKNGKAIAPEFLLERAFTYADGFFETMRTVNGAVPLLEYHLDRALLAAAALKINVNRDELRLNTLSILAEHKESGFESAVLKLIVGRAQSTRASYPAKDSGANFFSLIRPLVPAQQSRSLVALKSVKDPLPTGHSFSNYKLINRLPYSVAVQDMDIAENEEALFLNAKGEVIETMHHNLFLISNGMLHTPKLDGVGIVGVMRRVILEHVAKALSVNVKIGSYSMDQLINADGVFISNAVSGVTEVASIDQQELRSSPLVAKIATRVESIFSRGSV